MIAFSLPTWLHRQAPIRCRTLFELAHMDETRLPRFVRESEVALKYLRLLGPLDWRHFPDRPDRRFCIIRAMPTIDSDGCRPLVPEHADQSFRRMASSFSRAPESVVALVRNQWTACSGIWMDELTP